MQHARGFIVGCATGWLRSPGRQSTPTANWASFYGQKTTLLAYYIRVTKWLVTCLQSNPIGTNFAGFCLNLKQFYWYKRRGLLFKLRRPRAFQLPRGLFTGGGESHHFTGNRNSSPGCSPSPGSPTKGWIILMNLIQENVLSFSCIQYVTRIVEEWKKIIQIWSLFLKKI